MSIPKKAFLSSVILHILIVLFAFFISFKQEKPIEFIEIEIAQALPTPDMDMSEQEQAQQTAITPAPTKSKAEEKIVTKPKKESSKSQQTKKENAVSPNIVNPPQRNFVTDDNEDKILVPKKKLPSPTENFDDILNVNKPEIKNPEISKYEINKPNADKKEDSLPDISSILNRKNSNNSPSGVPDDKGKKGADVDLSIEGDLKNRKILSKPLIDPSLVRKAGTVKIKIEVTPEGLVQKTLILQKEENLERLAEENIKKWRFEKLPDDQPQINQSGLITFKFVLK